MSGRHDQRGSASKPVVTRDDLSWASEFFSSIEGLTTPLRADSLIAMQLGATPAEREIKLRKLSSMGFMHMSVKQTEDGKFSHYEWRL